MSARHQPVAGWSGGARRAVGSLRTVQPPPGKRWPLALQAGIAISTPVLVGALTGHESLGLLASSGAFTVLHVGMLPVAERAKVLPLFGLALVLAAALGASLSTSPVATGIGLAVVSIVTAAAYLAFRVGPPGSLFVTLVYGLSAHVTAPVDGVQHVTPATMVAAMACGCTFAYLVALTPMLRRANRGGARPLREILPGPGLDRTAREMLARIAIVSLAGTVVAMLAVDPTRAYWVVGAGIAVIGVRPGRGVAASRSLHRIVGTIAGAFIYLAIAWIPLPAVGVALVLGALQFSVELIVVRHYALALTLITPLVLILTSAATGTAGSLGTVTERVVDTAVGASIAALTGLIHGRRGRS
ncbi:FUSC family protein [Demequina sp. NBRC 110057]|uniref:FUSC family protein n=1 Tax=Demequina sp. NBRC 110057 TaxID=1570346 RepID=UPI001177E5A5|nr:FUSC family protein [Demequina sp. NBRC 110057]